ncbi:uncharacterized protein ATNIH1004_001644 [Aspergillus tanneri]|uniref:DUF6536 domain-containing protein n=1 Tax=Aspergillus tanneri TaxID=1220188 RepID=A0A5M9N6L1_9EURO|nr:uncharacterized protein ATNIH1004_001644 [Aspergillus tanneri]KAA8652739.1 hypothetical protein ATNIH1004_001644 [Aspergillus tanneri]
MVLGTRVLPSQKDTYDQQDDSDIDDVIPTERPKSKGWVKGVYLCAWSNTGILLLNLILTMIAYGIAHANKSKEYINESPFFGILYQGKCEVTNAWSTWLPVAINILSTAMLATSNYCMQCLSAPSRGDIDQAHSQGMWLDIGTFSARNLLLRSRKQQTLWLLLLVTSAPIHLVYNSVIISSLGAVNYGVVVAPVDFGPEDSLMGPVAGGFEFYMHQTYESLEAEILEKKLENLTIEQCVKEYAIDYPLKRGNLVVMVDRQELYGYKSRFAGLSSPANDLDHDTHMWMCSGLERLPPVCSKEIVLEQVKSGNWSVYGRPWVHINWALHVERPDGTRIEIGSWDTQAILRGVAANSSLTADVETLRTYLDKNDPREPRLDEDTRLLREFLDDSTNWKNSTWAANTDFGLYKGIMPYDAWRSGHRVSPPARIRSCLSKKMEDNCQLWFSLPIAMAVLLCSATKVACMFLTAQQDRPEMLLTVGDAMASFLKSPDPYTTGRCMMSKDDVSRPTSPSYLWKLGLANPNSTTRLGTVHADPMIIALLVNTPQAILSTIYLLWNNLFTRMLLAVEYNDFASERKALRVSTPQGDQRSTYFLSLPYRYAIPLTGTSALLHWLVSQSFYSVQLVKRNTVSHHLGYWTSSVGYSPIAMIFSIGVLALAIIAMIGIGLRRLKAHMPIAGTCSAAISAACHPPIGDEDAASKPVMWGEAPRDENTGERARYAHCSFTSMDVNLPNLVRLYS